MNYGPDFRHPQSLKTELAFSMATQHKAYIVIGHAYYFFMKI